MSDVSGIESASRIERYDRLHDQILELTRDLRDPVAAMSTVACALHEALPQASWTGFYRVVGPELLRVGPYQGPMGCLEIPFDRGVCGAAARHQETQVVPDVHAFPGHIACDSSTRSEIVVPVLDSSGRLVAVLDIDSHSPAAFDQVDRERLERLIDGLAPCFDGPRSGWERSS